jgi:hypothetical protein
MNILAPKIGVLKIIPQTWNDDFLENNSNEFDKMS